MASMNPLKLPSIDFTNLIPNTKNNDWSLTKSQVHQALVEFGAFEARFANISPELQTSMYNSLKDLFDLPLETKQKTSSTKPFLGYHNQLPVAPLFESMGIEDAPILDKVEQFTKILWPDGNPKISKSIHEFSEKLMNLDQMIRSMVLESLGLEKYMDEHMSSTYYELRVMKYRVPEANETPLGMSAHQDRYTLTILHQHQVGGLELQTRSGNWIKVQPSPNSFTVMIGDSLHAWTNGRLHSPYHRVMMSGDKPRYSIGLFARPKAGHLIKAPLEAVDEEHPLMYKPFELIEYLQFLHTEAGQQAQSPLKTYCGV